MRKSETGVALPAIRSKNTLINSSFSKGRMRSVFVEKVKQEISEDNDDYQAMANSQLTQQQKKLKQILRQFNEESHFILSNYIEAQPKVTKAQTARNPTVQLQVKQKEAANKDKILELCEIQLKGLESRCENLKYMTREQMQKQIMQINKEIETLRTQNKELSRGVTLNGLNICRGQKSTQIKDMQYQKQQLQAKKTQLLTSNEQINKQNESIKQKIVNNQKLLLSYQSQYKIAMDHEAVLHLSQKLKEQLKQKKKHIESLKQRNQQHSSGLKQKYFLKLRELDQFNNAKKKTQEELQKKQLQFYSNKRELTILQHQYSALKQGVMTIKLLDQQKK